MGKREETAARAAAMLEAGEEPRTVAAACGYRNVKAMLAGLSLVRTAHEETRKPTRINEAFDREIGRMIGQLREEKKGAKPEETGSLDAIEKRKKELESELRRIQWMQKKGDRLIAEGERYRILKGKLPGSYIICQRGVEGKCIAVTASGMDELTGLMATMRQEMANERRRAGLEA